MRVADFDAASRVVEGEVCWVANDGSCSELMMILRYGSSLYCFADIVAVVAREKDCRFEAMDAVVAAPE